jgi:hypothetical protein
MNGRELVRPTHNDRIISKKMDLREKGWEGEDWIHLAQDMDQWWAVVNTVMNFQVP